MRTNAPAQTLTPRTHEGGVAGRQTALTELRRAVATCLLWENTFYEKGSDLAQRIANLCDAVDLEDIEALAIQARTDLKLRHVPLFLALQAVRRNSAEKTRRPVWRTVEAVIQRPDEMAEMLALYWKAGRRPLAAQLKRGIARAFRKFSAYQLAKWDRAGIVKLRDAMFLSCPKPMDDAQATLWRTFVKGELASPDTWEVALSAGTDKRVTWERLLTEKKLGYLALLMNLRNMTKVGVAVGLVEAAIRDGAKGSRALPFRFVTAAKEAPRYAQALSDAMLTAIGGHLAGDTLLVVDVSGSMDNPISAKSVLSRWEAAGALAVLLREMAQACRIYTFSNSLVEVSNYRGLALVEAIGGSQPHGGTHLAAALRMLQSRVPSAHRLIVVTDEQTHDGIISAWAPRAYLINVAGYKPGLETSVGWDRISGWSERVVDWMRAKESEND